MSHVRVLAVDSSSEQCGIAIAGSDGTFHELLLHCPGAFAQVIFGELKQMLANTGLRLDDIDAFAAASGPGSFTGIRVALAATKGLAEAQSKPLFTVSNLQALAWHGTAPLRAPILDARRGEVYAALYDHNLHCISPEVVVPLAPWLETAPQGIEFITPNPELVSGSPVRTAPGSLAGAVAHIAMARLLPGENPSPLAADANYVRRSDADLKWREH